VSVEAVRRQRLHPPRLPQVRIECHDVQTWRQKNRIPPKDVPTVFAIGV
jgi:hypothetical protein